MAYPRACRERALALHASHTAPGCRRTLPLAVILNRFTADLFVLALPCPGLALVLHTVMDTAFGATNAGFAKRRTALMALRKPSPETFMGAVRRAVDMVKHAMLT
jgi:hypothetical protein